MPRIGGFGSSPPGGLTPPGTSPVSVGNLWQKNTESSNPTNKFVAAMQRVKHFAEEEVGSRVVAYGARVESQLNARRGGGGAVGFGSGGSTSGSGVSPGDVPNRWRPGNKGKGLSRGAQPRPEAVPGDGTHLGAVRDHTGLFTRLRATAIYIRETEAAAREGDARREGAAGSSASVDDFKADEPTRAARVSTSTAAIMEAARTLHKTKRLIETSLLPQYVGFVDSLHRAAAAATAARRSANAQSGRDAATAAQADVETHLATLLLVELELQLALKRLKTAHVLCSTINPDQHDEKETCVKRNVTAAFALCRSENTQKFKTARDRVQSMLVGNAAARVVSQQRLLRASDAAYADLERYYAALSRLKAECASHGAFRAYKRKDNDETDISDDESSAAREGSLVVAALTAAAAAARASLRAAYEDASLVKRLAGASSSNSADSGPEQESSPFGSPLVGDNSWRAHIAALDNELYRMSGLKAGDGDDVSGVGRYEQTVSVPSGVSSQKRRVPENLLDAKTKPAGVSHFRESIGGQHVLPSWEFLFHDDDDDAVVEGDPGSILGRNRHRAREAERNRQTARALKLAARKACASAATEYARGALRNAVDSVEEAARACAAHALAVGKHESHGESGGEAVVRAPGTPVPNASGEGTAGTFGIGISKYGMDKYSGTPSRNRTGGGTPFGPSVPAATSKNTSPKPTYPSVPKDVSREIVGLGRLGGTRSTRKAGAGKPPSTPRGSAAAAGTGMSKQSDDASPSTPSTPTFVTPTTPTSDGLGGADRNGPGFVVSGFRRTAASLMPVKEKTAALFLALQNIGASAAERSSSVGKQSQSSDANGGGVSLAARPGSARPVPSTEAGTNATGRGWFSRRRDASEILPTQSGAGDSVVGAFAGLRVWARRRGLAPGGRARAERSARYDEIAAKHQGTMRGDAS